MLISLASSTILLQSGHLYLALHSCLGNRHHPDVLMCFMQDQPSHSPQLNASLTSKPDKSNATLSSPKRCYSPDWLLSQQHQRQQEESPFSPQDLRNRVGEALWPPNWQSTPFQSSSSQPGSSQASSLQKPTPHTPHGWQSTPSQSSSSQPGSSQASALQTMSSRTPSSSPPGGGVATSPDIAHCNKGKGVLFFHGHIPSSSARHPADTGAMDQEAALTHKHNLEDMALHEPLRFVNRNGLATPFFGTVSSLYCTAYSPFSHYLVTMSVLHSPRTGSCLLHLGYGLWS